MNGRKSAEFVALLLAALSAGVFFGTRAALGPSTKSFTPRTYVEVQQATVRNLRPVMGALLPGAVAANLALVALRARARRSPAFALTLAGLLTQLAALVITALVELPLNARVLTWVPDEPPAGWEAARDRWAAAHTARTAAAVAGLGCLLAATLVAPARPDGD